MASVRTGDAVRCLRAARLLMNASPAYRKCRRRTVEAQPRRLPRQKRRTYGSAAAADAPVTRQSLRQN
jgi:hypothetical protein